MGDELYFVRNELFSIDLATTDDLEAVQSCARAAYAMYVARMGKEPAPMNADFLNQIKKRQVFVANSQGSFSGYVVFYPLANNMHLENIAVLPSYAGTGIGKKLIAFVEQQAKESGKQEVHLYTNETMTENLGMYSKLGYIEVERKQQMGFNRVFFRKSV